jgi:cell shape-determining protein MreD
MIPALVYWSLWLTYQKTLKEQSCFPSSKQKFLWGPGAVFLKRAPGRRRHLYIPVFLLLVCVVELIHILRNVGTTGVVYAGYEGFSLSGFLKTAVQMTLSTHGWIILIQLAIIGILFYWKREKGEIASPIPLHTLLWPVILAGLIVVPQVTLYMKSGIQERYLLPGVMGYTFLMVVLLRYIRLNTPLSRGWKWKAKEKRPELIVLILLIIVVLLQLRVTRYTAIGFAVKGQQTNAWLRSIQQNTQPEDRILVITRMKKHYEATISLKIYMNFKMKRKNALFSPATLDIKPGKHIFWKQLNNDFHSRFPGFRLQDPDDRDRMQTILIFPGLEKRFLDSSASWFNPAQFERYTNAGGFVSYYKKGTGEHNRISPGTAGGKIMVDSGGN